MKLRIVMRYESERLVLTVEGPPTVKLSTLRRCTFNADEETLFRV